MFKLTVLNIHHSCSCIISV